MCVHLNLLIREVIRLFELDNCDRNKIKRDTFMKKTNEYKFFDIFNVLKKCTQLATSIQGYIIFCFLLASKINTNFIK
jgi:hypothetical protein